MVFYSSLMEYLQITTYKVISLETVIAIIKSILCAVTKSLFSFLCWRYILCYLPWVLFSLECPSHTFFFFLLLFQLMACDWVPLRPFIFLCLCSGLRSDQFGALDACTHVGGRCAAPSVRSFLAHNAEKYLGVWN